MSLLYLSGVLPKDDNNNIFIPLQINGKYKRFTIHDFYYSNRVKIGEISLLLENIEVYCNYFHKYVIVKRIHQFIMGLMVTGLIFLMFIKRINQDIVSIYIPVMLFVLLHITLDRYAEIILKNYSRQIIFYLMPINEKIFNKRLITINVGPYALYIHINMNYTDKVSWHK